MGYNYMLDTSNIEVLDEEYDKRQQEIKLALLKSVLFFLEKGTIVRFRYWPGDVTSNRDVGYSGYGIKQILECNNDHKVEKDSDGLIFLSVKINKQIKEMITISMKEDHVQISPFFHIDILDKNNQLISSIQDHGCNVLMNLNESEILSITNQLINKSLFISHPGTIENNMPKRLTCEE